MSPVRQVDSQVCGLFISDIHWSEEAPRARRAEENWMKVQERYIKQLWEIQETHDVPIFIVGDLFNKWDSKPYLISSLISWLKGMYIFAIPGNHDLPNHSYLELQKSAYWTLVEAGAINHMIPGGTHTIGPMVIHPYPYGFPVKPCPKPASPHICLDVVLIHSFIWTEKTGHKGADDSHKLGAWLKKLEGYDVAVFGDNHKPFFYNPKPGVHHPVVLNCGTFMRRHSDEVDISPAVGILKTDGTMTRQFLDVRKDVFTDLDTEIKKLESVIQEELAEFAADLGSMQADRISFAKTVIRWCQGADVPDKVKQILLEVVKHGKHS
jgi:hypothetical protein